METTNSLKEIENRAYRSIFEDGIYDILAAIMFFILAWISVLDYLELPTVYGYLFGIILIPLGVLAKRFITVPRLGAVKFGVGRRKRKLYLLIGCAVFIFLTLPIAPTPSIGGAAAGLAGFSGIPLIVGFMMVPLIVLAAYFLDFPRLYIYALLISFGMIHSGFLSSWVGIPYNSLISFGVPGIIIFLYGLVLLLNFMQKYPKSSPEINHAG